jgi:hypothetical protein
MHVRLEWDSRMLTSLGVKERQGGPQDYNQKGAKEEKLGREVEEY